MSWEMVSITDVCNPKQWKTIPATQLKDSGYPVFGANGIIGYYDDYNHEKPVIAITCRGATCGSINMTLPQSYVTGNAMCLDDVDSDRLDERFLFSYLKTYDFDHIISGSAQPQITRTNLEKLEIPLPPLPEQQRIADILDKAEAINQKREKALALCDEFLRATFLDMFGDPVSNPKGWNTESIGNLTSVLTGSTPSRKVAEYYEGDIPWVKTTEVNGKDIYDTSEKISDKAILESSCKLVPKDSIVMAMYGQGKTRGQVARLKVEAATNQACAVITPTNKIDMDYLYLYLLNSYERLRSLGRGGNQPNLNLNIVKNIEVLVPPIELQQKFSSIVEKVNAIKAKVQQAQELPLFNALSQQAFKGELTQ